MKMILRFALPIAFLLTGSDVFGQSPSSGQNYVISTTVKSIGRKTVASLDGLPVDSLNKRVQYFDGLGRPLQTVDWQGSPTRKDVVQPVVYDAFGRETFKYLPYAEQSSVDASYKTSALTSQGSYYSSGGSWDGAVVKTAYPFSKTVFEPSPLNRVLEQGFPGAAWQPASSRTTTGRTAVMAYGTNIAAEVLNWTVTATGASSVNYGANKLYKTIIKDENWVSGKIGTTEEFKDLEGRVVLKRVWSTETASLSTYYVYDDLGNLRYVVPPGFTAASFTETATTFKGFIYAYRYDGRKRLVRKKLPGKGWEFMVYNKIDQLVMSQDSMQRRLAPQQWTFSKYDGLGRVILTGIYEHTGSVALTDYLASVQSLADAVSPQWETWTGTGNGYSSVSFPASINTILTINYYDHYTIPGLPADAAYNQSGGYSAKTRGLATASKVNVVSTANYLWTVNYYDDRGRMVRNVSQHYKGGITGTNNYDEISSTYNFAGELKSSVRKHYVGGVESLYVKNDFSYDHMGRAIDTYQKTGNTSGTTANSPVLLSRNEYNEIGQLKAKKLHSTVSGVAVPATLSLNGADVLEPGQQRVVAASSSITLSPGFHAKQGSVFQASITEASFAQQISFAYNERGWLSSQTAPLFSQSLKYNEAVSGVIAQYNGNIARQEWAGTKYYNYGYDALNRLTSALASTGNNEELGYDAMGNITSLQRKLSGTLIDQLSYSYTTGTNTLASVADANTNTSAEYQLPGATSYSYDGNGSISARTNAVSTANNISAITYNYMNLPKTMTAGGNTLTYTYDATGNKLRKVFGTSSNNDYISGIHYEGGVFAFAQTPEGRVTRNGTGTDPVYLYEYTLNDHLGNGRVYFDINGGSARKIQEEEYYAFGKAIQVGSLSGSENKYQYNGKEKQDELKMLDYGARFYDPVIGRWNVIDPLAEKFASINPYNYTDNNPVNNTDPDGMDIIYGANSTTYTLADAQSAFAQLKNQMSSNQKEDPIGWLQKMLNYFGFGTNRPKNAEEASDQSERRAKLSAINAELDENMEVAENIPLAGGLLKMSKGAMGNFSQGKDFGSVVDGGASILFDISSASAIKAGGMLFIKGFGNVSKELFHRKFKSEILKLAGDFSKSVGKNPDIIVEQGKVVLKGVGDFKGKVIKTTIEASKIMK
jgi:RHS repeat-associated protein